MRVVTGICFCLMTSVLVQSGLSQQFQPTPRKLGQEPVRSGVSADPVVPAQSSQQSVSASGELRISSAGVVLIEDIDVPAREAGQLISVDVREGDMVTKDGLIARIDDRLARRQVDESTYKQKITDIKATDMTKIQSAQRLFDYSQEEFDRTKGLYIKGSESAKAFNESRTNLELKRLELSGAELERKIAEMESLAEAVRLNAAQDSIERHALKAPIGGQVFEIFRQQGEWVMAGDKVFRIARMDKLRVKCRVNSRSFNPGDVANRRVTVIAELAGGRTVNLNGQVTFVAMEKVGNADEFDAWAEVDNQQENGNWLLLPGSTVDMTIHLNEKATAAKTDHVSGPVSNRPSTNSVSANR